MLLNSEQREFLEETDYDQYPIIIKEIQETLGEDEFLIAVNKNDEIIIKEHIILLNGSEWDMENISSLDFEAIMKASWSN